MGETLRHLPLQITVGHGMADHDRLQPRLPDYPTDIAAYLALAAAGAHGADGYDRLPAFQHCRVRPRQAEFGAPGQNNGGPVHHLLVGEIAVGEYNLVNAVFFH